MSQFSKTRYKVVGLGGTFDHFHEGHAFFLTYASELGFSLLIGVTDDSMVHAKQFADTVQSYRTRAKAVHTFCEKNGINHEIVKLTDTYGPTISRESVVKAICATTETEKGAQKINQVRRASGMPELPIFICRMVMDEDGQELHADRIRAGEVNRQGKVYKHALAQTVTLTAEQKKALAKPLGKVIAKPKLSDFEHLHDYPSSLPICVVGDSSLEYFNQLKLPVSIGIFDGKKQRVIANDSPLSKLEPDVRVSNQAGTISTELTQTLQECLRSNHSQTIFVEGEEDLATAVLILLAPLQSLIYYGQPEQGIVEVVVTEMLKDQMLHLFQS